VRGILSALLTAGALAALAIVALGARTQTSAPQTAPTPASAATAGMRAVIDPETGQIGAPGTVLPPLTPEEQALLEPANKVQLHAETMPDGSLKVDLQGTGQEFMIMTVDAQGKKNMKCVHDPNAVQLPQATADRGDR
jgi:hypothetical protein